MARTKKDGKYLNVFIEKQVYDDFENLCDEIGQSKTLATERALVDYVNKMRTSGQFANNKNNKN